MMFTGTDIVISTTMIKLSAPMSKADVTRPFNFHTVQKTVCNSNITLDEVYRATTVEYHEPRRWSIMSHDGGVS